MAAVPLLSQQQESGVKNNGNIRHYFSVEKRNVGFSPSCEMTKPPGLKSPRKETRGQHSPPTHTLTLPELP